MSENVKNERRTFLRGAVAGAAAGAATWVAARGAHGQDQGGAAAGGPMPGMAAPPTKAVPDGAKVTNLSLELRVIEHELVPGVVVPMMAYERQVPAPTIRIEEGEWLAIDFLNSSDEMHTIHWHGLLVGDYRMDGVPYLTQPPVMRGERYRYEFQARPYGTHFYHCHFGTSMHMQAGMYGALIVERKDDPIRARYPYTQDYVLLLSSIDTVFVRDQMNAMFARMRQRDALASRGALSPLTQAVFGNFAELRRRVAKGWVPPYALARTEPRQPAPNFFTINGKSYPATEPVRVREGEWTRLRFANAGNVSFAMHIHGHDWYHVCSDGAPLPAPVRGNTLLVSPGKTEDVVFLADNPGIWALHDHDVGHTTNNGIYPGGAMTHIAYEGFKGAYEPEVSLDE